MHVADRLQALLSGSLPPAERQQAESHLSGCAACREERDLLLSARGVIGLLAAPEPRVGFAARVALAARDRRPRQLAQWLRWVCGGAAAAGVAATAAVLLIPPQSGANRSDEVKIAQRLDLFEDMAILQNREALEDIEVVSVLHTLEARP